MLCSLAQRTGLKISYYFPVKGHSYLPADRVFGRVEKELRKIETILLPQQYFEEFAKMGIIMEYPNDWMIVDLRAFAKSHLKAKQAFLLSKVKQIEIKARSVSISESLDGPLLQSVSLLKRGKTFSDFNPAVLSPQNLVKAEKRNDVRRLLEAIGVSTNHPAHSFYAEVCHDVQVSPGATSNTETSDSE